MRSAKLLSGPFNHLRQCRHGVMLYNCNDTFVGKSLEYYGEWSEGEIDALRQIIRPGDVVVEAGANIGSHTLFFAQAVGPQGQVYAFEPQRLVFQTLCANMALNSLTNVHGRQAALGAQRGFINVPALNFAAINNFGGVRLGLHLPGEMVEVLTVDSLNLPACRLLKADVEGMELEVLQGAAATIDRLHPCLYLENDKPEKHQAILEFAARFGYAMYGHYPPMYNPQNYYGNSENVFDTMVSGNLFCVHESSQVNVQGGSRIFPGDPSPFVPPEPQANNG
jgi:FkbM family methyltransferase